MRVRLTSQVYLDIEAAMDYYSREAGNQIAAEFYNEFRRCQRRIGDHPQAYPVVREDIRRINFLKFPYHVLYQIAGAKSVRILAVKHDYRDPSFGLDR